MPITSSSRPLRSRLPVQPEATGGYTRVSTPNPNTGMAVLGRTGGTVDTNPLGSGIRQMLAGVANRQASDYAQSTTSRPAGAPNLIGGVLPDPRWEGLKQALFEQGVGRLRTSAAGGGVMTPSGEVVVPKGGRPGVESLGFFDVQDSNNLQRQALMRALQAQDVNQYGRVR